MFLTSSRLGRNQGGRYDFEKILFPRRFVELPINGGNNVVLRRSPQQRLPEQLRRRPARPSAGT